VRQRALKKDRNDWKEFRHHRDRLVGSYSNEWLQDMPAWWTADGASLPLRGQMRGQHAFLVCNGPSFNGLDKRPLDYAYTMTVNNGPAACYQRFVPSAWTMVDDPSRFLASIWLNPAIQKFVPHAHSEKPIWNSFNGRNELFTVNGKPVKVRQCPNVVYIHRNEKWHAPRYWIEDTFNWGNHTDITDEYGHKGGRSVMLVALKLLFHLGFRHIYLLGADFKMDENHKYSFDEERKRGAINCNTSTYKALNDRLADARQYAEDMGLHIYNCNPDSGLTAFEHKSYDDAIKEAFWWADGDYRNLFNGNERTNGMYQSPEKKKGKK